MKAFIQTGLSAIPRGDWFNFILQSRMTRSLPVSDDLLIENLETALSHLDAVSSILAVPLEEASFYEFGAGWSLGVSLALAGLGVKNQTLVDIRPLARTELVSDAVTRLRAIGERCDVSFDLPPWPGERTLTESLRHYGITYLAPCDARNTGLPDDSIDVITSTSTFEHIPDDDVLSILRECRRLLRPTGAMSAWIDYKDHYSSFDERISPYNFLQFNARTWRFYSPPLHYQNRLRHREYVEMFARAGFEDVQIDVIQPTLADLALLDDLDIARRFDGFTRFDLGVRDAHFVVRPAATSLGGRQ